MVFGAGEPAAPLAPGDLRFDAVAPASPNLRFGAEGADTGLPPVDATLVGTLPLPVLLAEGRVATPVALVGTLPGLTLQVSLRSPVLVDLAATLPLPTLSALAVARVDVVLGGTLPGPVLQAGVSAPVNASLTGELPDLKLAARARTAKPSVKLVFSRDPATDGNLLFAPGDEYATLTGAMPAPSFAASIGPQQQIVRLRFSVEASDSTRLVFGRDGEAPVKVESAALTGTLPGPTLQAQVRYGQDIALTGTLQGPTFQAFGAVTVEVTLTGVLPGQTLLAKTRSVARARLTGTLPPPEVLTEARYFSNTSRPTVGQRTTVWHPTHLADQTGLEHRQQVGQKAPAGWQQAWQQGRTLQPGVDHPLPKMLARDHVPGESGFQEAQPLPDLTAFRHQEAARSVRVLLADAFEQAAELRDATGFRYQVADRTKRGSVQGEWENACSLRRAWGTDFQPARPWVVRLGRRYQEAVVPPPGISIFERPKPPGPPVCYEAEPGLVFELPLAENGNLLLRCDYASAEPTPWKQVIVPVQRVYIVLNNVALKRTSDNAVVPALNLTLSLDVSSWTWGFQASLPAAAQALVEPTSDGPVGLSAWVNGTEFCVLAEQISRERTFGQTNIRVTGRGINAELDAPYAPVMNFSNADWRTSQQLLEDVLNLNGVSLGYGITYGQEAWEVPPGVFNHQGTYISALGGIAQAGGGYLLPHPSLRSFSVQALYPQAPWEWASVQPNFILPADVVTREGVQWKEQPAYNGVFVSGEAQGVLGQVTRAGTAGDLLAPMVVDPLITTAAAARQRGLAILGNTGRQLHHTLSLPVLSATGVIQPGAYVQYNDGEATRVGLVRSTEVSVGLPDVIQTIGVECHA